MARRAEAKASFGWQNILGSVHLGDVMCVHFIFQRMTNSSSSPSLLNDSAKPYAGHGKTWFLSLCYMYSFHSKNNFYVLEILTIVNRYKEENKNQTFYHDLQDSIQCGQS